MTEHFIIHVTSDSLCTCDHIWCAACSTKGIQHRRSFTDSGFAHYDDGAGKPQMFEQPSLITQIKERQQNVDILNIMISNI